MFRTYSHRQRIAGLLAGVGVALSLGYIGPLQVQAAEGEDVPVLPTGQDKVLYLPISGDSPAVQKVRQKEIPAIERFLKGRKIVQEPVLTRFDAPEIYLQVEPQLVLEAHDEACKGLEDTAPSVLLGQAQEALKAGRAEDARKDLETARRQLPCSENRLSRSQIAELLLWSGLAHPIPVGEEAQGYIRAGLAADPLIAESAKLPPNVAGMLQKTAADMEHALHPIDVHVPQGEGEMWTHKNLFVDGRRVVFDKLFLQLVPGVHYVQITMPDDRSWGAFLEIKADSSPDLADLARQKMGLKARYRQQFEKVLTEGVAGPSFLQGLKLYTARLKREQIYLTAITQEADGTWITLRRYHLERGIEVPALSRVPSAGAVTASVPLPLSQPWAIEVGLNASTLNGAGFAFQSPGGGLEVNAFYLLPRRLRLGGTLGLGGRAYQLAGAEDESFTRADFDLVAGLELGLALPLNERLQLLPDLGYVVHVNQLRGLPIYCSNAPLADQSYACGLDRESDANAVVYNLRGLASGPRLRVGLGLKPFGSGALTLRGLLRVGYSPQLVSLKDQVGILVTSQDINGTHDSSIILSIDENSRSLLIHQFDVFLGINGTY